MMRTLSVLLLSMALSACGSASLHDAHLAQRAENAAAARALLATAPSQQGAELEAWLAAQHQRLADERTRIQQDFAQAERICWQRFAVNDCLRQARRQRRQGLDAVREQQLQLSRFERERDADRRLRRLEQKQP